MNGPGGLAARLAIADAQDGLAETAVDKASRAADWLLRVERDDMITDFPSKNPPRFASTKQQGDPQRSARIACKIMQNDSGPENPSGPPRMSRMLIRGHRWLHWLEVNLA